MFSFQMLETETGFRFIFWKRNLVSMFSTETGFHVSVSDLGNGNRFPFPIFETETGFSFLFWKRIAEHHCTFVHFIYESTHILLT